MKKFKFLSMALVATAIVGCTSDDLNVADNYVLPGDGTEVLATINDPGLDGGSMRAGFATNVTGDISSVSQTAYFTEGDEFKMYCTDTWKPQVYKFLKHAKIDAANAIDASVFTWADEDSKYNKKDENILSGREYGVFPADSFLFPDENRSVLEYHIANQINYGEQKGANSGVTGEAKKLYKSLVPMFGFCVDDKITFNYMTSLLRVEMMGLTVDKPYTLVLTSDDNYYKLSGKFESTVFDAADYKADDAHLPVFGATHTDVDNAEAYLAVTVTPKDPDIAVYLPLPTGKYDVEKLKLYCVEKEIEEGDDLDTDMETFLDEAEPVTLYTREVDEVTLENPQGRKVCNDTNYPNGYTLGRGTYLLAVVGDAVGVAGVTVNDLETLNEIIAKYAGYKRNVSIEVTLGEGITMNDATEAILIPQLENDLTLTINAGSSKTIGGSKGVRITNAEGTETDKGYTATINFGQGVVAAKVTSDVNQNMTIGGNITGNAVEFNPTAKVKVGLAGVINNNSPITVKNASVVTVLGNMASVTIEKADTVKVQNRVANLNVKANTNIDVTGAAGIATKLTIEPKTHVDITVSGVGNIKEVEAKAGEKEDGSEDATFTINATWDEETTEAIEDADANGGKIYTALQFAALQNSGTPSEVTLYANVTVADDEAEWTPLTGVTSFDGQGNIVKGLKIAAEGNATNVGFFSTLDAASASGEVSVKDLTLEDLVITVAAPTTTKQGANSIGALVGSITASSNNATIEGVTIKGAKINGKKSNFDVGGLIGKATGTVIVEGTSIDAAIAGEYNLGGIIGSTGTGSDITIGYLKQEGDEKESAQTRVEATTTITVLPSELKEYWDHAGKVALGIGVLDGNLKMDNMWARHSDVNTASWYYDHLFETIDKAHVFFKGCLSNGNARYYIGFSPEADKVTVQGITLEVWYKTGSDSETVTNKNNVVNYFAK